MSSDIMNSQISKDMPKKSPVATEVVTTAQTEAMRQAMAIKSGNAPPPDARQEKEQPTREDVSEAVMQLNQYVQEIHRDLHFSVDDSSGRTVIRVVNSETEEVVRQIPSDEVLRILRNLREQMDDDSSTGLIFETSA